MKKIFVFILMMIMPVIVFAKDDGKAQDNRSKDKVVVRTQVAVTGDLKLILSYIGSLKAQDEVGVYPKVSGKLAEYKVNEGDKVNKGDVVALIDRDETGLQYELAQVLSPLTGIVGRTYLDKGATVSSGAGSSAATALAMVVNMDKMVVKVNAPEADIPYIKRGLSADILVDAYGCEKFNGVISKVSEVVDAATRTLPFEITINNADHRLKSGMFARISVVAGNLANRLVLPQDALVQEVGIDYVFIVQGDKAKKQPVTLGVKEDSKIEIVEGIRAGDEVIVFGQQGLKDGADIEIKN